MAGMQILLIKTHGDGSFVFAPDGEPAIVAKIHDANGDLADLVAWQPERPGRWWLRRGDIAVLGAHAAAVANYHGDSIRLIGTPQDWFQSGGNGACVLLWAAPLDELFGGVGTVEQMVFDRDFAMTLIVIPAGKRQIERYGVNRGGNDQAV